MKLTMYFGTLSRYGENQGLEVTILSGDRDTFQLATDRVTIRIPRTKGGKTETEEYNREKIIETYGIEPKQLIDVKGLQGDTSDNIPGVPGIGEKTALNLIKKFGSIENLYDKLDNGESELKGKQKENIENNKDLAFLSKTLGTINLEVPISDTLDDFKLEEWNKPKVLELFKELNFNRYIDRFSLREEGISKKEESKELYVKVHKTNKEVIELIKEQKQMIFYMETEYDMNPEKIIKERVKAISIYNPENNETYYLDVENENNMQYYKEIFEDEAIKKVSINLTSTYILLKQAGIDLKGIEYDVGIAAYILNPTSNKLEIERLMEQYLEIDINEYVQEEKQEQINLFDKIDENKQEDDKRKKDKYCLYAYAIYKLKEITLKELDEIGAKDLFYDIDMPTIEVLSSMQWNGMHVDEDELNNFGKELTEKLNILTQIIYEMAGEEFNINSTKQLGEILFEKMKLPVIKKTKNGYSTDVDVLEKLKGENPIIEKILDYRQIMKLNSTYVEGLKTYINPKTKRIHSFFHQTITATRKNKFNRAKSSKYTYKIRIRKKSKKSFRTRRRKSVCRCRLFSN